MWCCTVDVIFIPPSIFMVWVTHCLTGKTSSHRKLLPVVRVLPPTFTTMLAPCTAHLTRSAASYEVITQFPFLCPAVLTEATARVGQYVRRGDRHGEAHWYVRIAELKIVITSCCAVLWEMGDAWRVSWSRVSLFPACTASLKSRKEQIEMDSRELKKKLKGLRRG